MNNTNFSGIGFAIGAGIGLIFGMMFNYGLSIIALCAVLGLIFGFALKFMKHYRINEKNCFQDSDITSDGFEKFEITSTPHFLCGY
jgi:hypothetical protein